MNKVQRLVLVIMIGVMIHLPFGFAGEGSSGGYLPDAAGKLGHGIAEILTSVVEVPCSIYYDAKDSPYSAAFTGLFKGAFRLVRRAVVGVVEVGTFFVPSEPMIEKVCNEKTWHNFS